MALPIFRNMDLPFFLLLLVLVIHTINIEIFQANTVPVVDRISIIWDHFPTGAKDKCRRTVGMHKRCLLPRELHLLHTKPKQVGKMKNILTANFSQNSWSEHVYYCGGHQGGQPWETYSYHGGLLVPDLDWLKDNMQESGDLLSDFYCV